MSRLNGLVKRVTSAYERFEFHEIFHAIYNFCVVDMSSFYLDILKDRLYTCRADSVERRAAQWALSCILNDMTRLMAPILSFTAEEIWSHISKNRKSGEAGSIFLAGFPQADEKYIDPELEKRWDRLIIVRNEANKALEIKRQEKLIGNALEAELTFFLSSGDYDLLSSYREFLPALFIVSVVNIERADGPSEDAYASPDVDGLFIKVTRAAGEKCERCWNRSKFVGTFNDHPGICERCHAAVSAK
jgi:isoleucyl-tRNA synthetase